MGRRPAEAAAAPVTTAEAPATWRPAAETVTAAAASLKGIETVLTETVPLVAAPAATSSIETHKTKITFASPSPFRLDTRTIRAGRQSGFHDRTHLCASGIAEKVVNSEWIQD